VVFQCAICFLVYYATLHIGFALDDFFHIDYASRAVHGDFQDFLSKLYGNWGNDIYGLRCYRPLVSLSFLLQYLCFGANSGLFHCVNVLLFGCCCGLTSLICFELAKDIGWNMKTVVACFAGLLFAVFPLHVDTVGSVTGQVDLLCTVFYAAAFLSYLHYKQRKTKFHLISSLVFFVLSLLCKEMAVTFPLVVTAAEFILFVPEKKLSEETEPGPFDFAPPPSRPSLRQRSKDLAYYWCVLVGFAIIRTLALGTVVGGYANNPFTVLPNLRDLGVFTDSATVYKLLFPVNGHFLLTRFFQLILSGSYLGLAGLGVWHLAKNTLQWRPITILLIWLIASVLPTYQIWHIYPNLVGGRLFFLASLPLCMIMPMIGLPAGVKTNLDRFQLLCGLIILFTISGCWLKMLGLNTRPYVLAAVEMRSLSKQVISLALKTPPGRRVLFLDLPQDYLGAPMLGRPEFLETICRPPLCSSDLSNRILSMEPVLAGGHDYVLPDEFQRILNAKRLAGVYKWSNLTASFVPWRPPSDISAAKFVFNPETSQKLTLEPEKLSASLTHVLQDQSAQPEQSGATDNSTNKQDQSNADSAKVEVYPNFLRIYPGASDVVINFPPVHINNWKISLLKVQYTMHGRKESPAQLIRFLWSSQSNLKVESAKQISRSFEVGPDTASDTTALFEVGRFRSWTFGSPVCKIGLKIAGGPYYIDLKGLSFSSGVELRPQSYLSTSASALDSDPFDYWLLKVRQGDKVYAHFDVSQITGVEGVRLVQPASQATFSEQEANLLIPHIKVLDKITRSSGLNQKNYLEIPSELTANPGLHQVRIEALDANELPFGLPGEPLSFMVK
jgi:hypothetical protein